MSKKRITDVGFSKLLNDNDSLFINQNDSIKQIKKSDVLFDISNGGTGAITAEEARRNLGALGKTDVVDNFDSTSANLPLSANKGREINSQCIEINSQLTANDGTSFRFGVTEDGQYGYIIRDSEGADTVYPFKNLVRDTQATAAAAQITQGYTAWVNGELIVGTRPAAPQTLSGTVERGIPAGYATHQIKVDFNPPFDIVPEFTQTIQCFNDDTTGRFLYVKRDHAMFEVVHSHGVETSSVKITWTATVQ